MQKYIEAQKKRGFKLISIWVPKDKVETVRRYAERWRRDQGHTSPRAKALYRKKVTK